MSPLRRIFGKLPGSFSLRGLLLAIVLILTIPPLVVEAVLLYRYAEGERARAEAELDESAKGAANLIDSKFKSAENVLRVLAASPLLTAGDLPSFERLLRELNRDLGHPLVLIEPDGTQIINTFSQAGATLPRSDVRRWAPAITERRPYVTNVFRGALSGEGAVAVVVPVIRDGVVKWALTLTLYGRDFADVIKAPGVPANWIVSVVDRDGVHLLRSHKNEEFAGRPLVPVLVAHLKALQSGTLRTTTLEGIPAISTTARAPTSSWAVAIGRPVDELTAPLQRQYRNLFLAGLLIVSAGMGIALLLARRIDSAVANMSAQAQALARGEPHPQVPTNIVEARIIDEALAKASAILYARQEEMRALNESLEQQVAARTVELAAANAELKAEMRRRAESEQNFSVLVQGVVDYSLILLKPDGTVATWNQGAERMKGYAAEEIVAHHFSRFYTEEDRARGVPETVLAVAAREGKVEVEGWRVRKSGERFWAHTVLDAIRGEGGNLVGYAKITRDITERRQAEADLKRAQDQLAHAQKMEATGQLTGGIAHDFNNMLAVILASARLLQERMKRGENVQQFIDGIRDAAERGATLTKRLLAFSRRQPLAPEPVDANRLVKEMSEIFQRTIPEHIEIETVLAGGLWVTRADPSALENALLNLVTNARDAMPEGGKLTIETANTHLDDGYAAAHTEVRAGQYVMIAITDTGAGMSPEVIGRAFEPFFTTKPVGKGTGLGLSQVYGFAKQSNGHVEIYSESGHGTTVKIYLPRVHAADTAIARQSEGGRDLALARHNEQILLVEDDASLRVMAHEMLIELGYRCASASGGAEALEILEHEPVALMITDVVMPGINGRQLADAAKQRRPDLKVIFTTGYTQNAVVHNGVIDAGIALLTKPFTLEALGHKVREVLES
jgi:PAS domain S-box-containing protein